MLLDFEDLSKGVSSQISVVYQITGVVLLLYSEIGYLYVSTIETGASLLFLPAIIFGFYCIPPNNILYLLFSGVCSSRKRAC